MGDLRRMDYERRAKEWLKRRSGFILQTRECSQNIRSLQKREEKLLAQRLSRLDLALRLLHADYKRDVQNMRSFQRTISARSVNFNYKSFREETSGKYMYSQFQKSRRHTITASTEDAKNGSYQTGNVRPSIPQQYPREEARISQVSEPSGILKRGQSSSQGGVSTRGKANATARKSLTFTQSVVENVRLSCTTDHSVAVTGNSQYSSAAVPPSAADIIARQSQRLMAALLDDRMGPISSRPWSKSKTKRTFLPRPMTCTDKTLSTGEANMTDDRPKTADVTYKRPYKSSSFSLETRSYKNLRDTYKAILQEEMDPAAKRILALRAFEFMNSDSLEQRVTAMCTKMQQL